MISEDEERFLVYWEKNREREKKTFRQLLIGLPIGLLFGIPILLNFISGWYKRANMWARGHSEDSTGTVLLVAGLIIIAFASIFYKRHKWDIYEQRYLEIRHKQQLDKGPAPDLDSGMQHNETS